MNGFERKRVEDDEAPNVDVIAERFIFMARRVTLISLHEIVNTRCWNATPHSQAASDLWLYCPGENHSVV